jgi:hypothetical protein
LNSGLAPCKADALWATPPAIYSGYFGNRVSQSICSGWPATTILPISASQVAKITDVSHRRLVSSLLFTSQHWPWGEAFPPSCAPAIVYNLATGPKARRQTDHGLKTPKLWAKINLFLRLWFQKLAYTHRKENLVP